ncbi:MAG: D-alanyl-D-alanine carboxypeptidase family protein [Clostridia bacterium]|nr:D-alanyl-D-alanine carboxypeptidase family protein [Clostridia bacterium]
MEISYRRSLRLLLAGLLLMLLTGAYYGEEMPQNSRIKLAQTKDIVIYAGAEVSGDTQNFFFDRETLLKGKLLCIGVNSPLPHDMPVQQARNVRKLVGLYVPAAQTVNLSEETIYALCDLCAENPLVRTWITDGMRAPSAQYALQNETFEQYRKLMPASQALNKARTDVPDSGKGEHQLSAAFDLKFTGELDWSYPDPLDRSEDGRWLRENAWRFGFIRRYPPEKSSATGVNNEELHFRYVGREHALIMRIMDWCLEEYLSALERYGGITLERENKTAYVLSVPMGEHGAVFCVPEGYSCSVSADNLGRAVCMATEN